MKFNVRPRYVFFLGMFLLLNQNLANAQQYQDLAETAPVYLKSITRGDMANTIYLRTDFAEARITNSSALNRLKGRVVTGIDLVYSDCRESETFDQVELNKERLQMLNQVKPELLSNPVIEWKLIAQTDCGSTEGGHKMFHGFVIHMRPLMTEKERAKEINELDELISGLESGGPIDIDEPPVKEHDRSVSTIMDKEVTSDHAFIPTSFSYSWDSLCVSTTFYGELDKLPTFFSGDVRIPEYLNKVVKIPEVRLGKGDTGYVRVHFTISGSGKVTDVSTQSKVRKDVREAIAKAYREMPRWNPAVARRRSVTVKGSMDLYIRRSGWIQCCGYTSPIVSTMPIYNPVSLTTDSTIFKVFNRNPEWNNMLVVCDFTGSMFPYTSQLLIWHKLNFNANKERVKHYTFFNDGDLKPDRSKKVGKTGGIYHSEGKTFDDIADLAKATMRGGSGGDCPENNLEATLEGMDKCPDCTDIVMIADNYATPRDLSLYYKLNKPVHIILCGSLAGANVEYLNLVRKVGGSIHTMEQDIKDLTEMNEGETIEIAGIRYRISEGEFQMVKRI